MIVIPTKQLHHNHNNNHGTTTTTTSRQTDDVNNSMLRTVLRLPMSTAPSILFCPEGCGCGPFQHSVAVPSTLMSIGIEDNDVVVKQALSGPRSDTLFKCLQSSSNYKR